MSRPPAGPPPVGTSALAPRDEHARRDLQNYVTIASAFDRADRRDDLRAMLGSDDLVDRFLAVALNAIATNSDLLVNADPVSIIQAVKDSATLGLEPTGLTGEAVIVRYKNQAKLMPMYRGYLKRVRNTGKVEVITAKVVYANDEFDYWYTPKGADYTHHPARPSNPTGLDGEGNSERGDYWGAYCFWRFPSGYQDMAVMPAVEINHIRDTYSEAVRSGRPGPWDTSWGEMAIKTVIRRACKLLPQGSADAVAIAAYLAPLEALDAAADAARDEAEGGQRFDASRARSAALAAVARRGAPLPAIAAPADEAVAEVAAEEPGSEPVSGGNAETLDDEPPLPLS